MKSKRLGDMLLSMNMITEEQLEQALEMQKTQKKRLGRVLVDNGFITESQLIDTLHMQLGIDFIDLTKTDIEPEMSGYIPKALAKKYNIVPVRTVKDTLFLAMEDPLNFVAIEEAKNTSGKKIVPMIAFHSAVDHAINVLYGNEGAAKAMAQMREEAGFTQQQVKTEEESAESDAPAIRLVNSIIERACSEKASDIHFEPTSQDMNIRMRIDGRLHKIMVIPDDLKNTVISRLKIMSRLDTVERRIPQDGRAMARIRGSEVDMRVSTLPTIYGEKIVIRILGTDEGILTRRGIGIPDEENGKLDRLLAGGSGVIMIVGPTGSGKSSTMYTLINELLSEETNLITLEDPVEYNIDGAAQVQINEKAGLTFAGGLRAVLRQDPDIICVGEIRDGETAEIAMRAAMTGHLVITTVHTEDAVSAIDRLKDMGVEPYLISAGIRGIISQRLLRKVCGSCREKYRPGPAILKMAGISPEPERDFYHGRGCDVCYHSGYKGRTGVFEVLVMNDTLRRCITQGADKQTFREAVKRSAEFTPMRKHAAELVEQGVTTAEEMVSMLTAAD